MVIETVGVASALFVATNIDDVFLLLAFMANPRIRMSSIVLGQYLGIAALVAASVVAALLALVVPKAWIGLLGLVPIVLGVRELFELIRERGKPADDDDIEVRPGVGAGHVLAVAAITIANGGDNIAVYIPLFAVQSRTEILISIAVFAVLTGALCLLARLLITHRTIGGVIRKWGRALLPPVLIGLGVLILYEAGTFAAFSALAG